MNHFLKLAYNHGAQQALADLEKLGAFYDDMAAIVRKRSPDIRDSYKAIRRSGPSKFIQGPAIKPMSDDDLALDLLDAYSFDEVQNILKSINGGIKTAAVPGPGFLNRLGLSGLGHMPFLPKMPGMPSMPFLPKGAFANFSDDFAQGGLTGMGYGGDLALAAAASMGAFNAADD